jgi:hypothetical protein
MQNFQEAQTWFPVDTEKYRFCLSMRTQAPQEGASRSFPSTTPHRIPVGHMAVSSSLLTPTSDMSGLLLASPITGSFPDASALPPPPPLHPTHPPRVLLPRNNSFPPAGANGRPAQRPPTTASSTNNSPPLSAANNPDAESKPSLVKHLQKIHGLTKKRNFGLHSSRAPFIRDEATAAVQYTSVPSVDPANGRPRRNTGVHASKSRMGDDPRRPRRGSVHFSFPDSARVPSPESDSSTSVGAPSPTATVAGVHAASPPVVQSPVTVGLQMGIPLSSSSLNLADAGYQAAPPPPGPPPLWQGEQTLVQAATSANPTPAFTEMSPPGPPQQLPTQNHVLAPGQVQGQVPRAHTHHPAVPLGPSSYTNVPHGNADSPVAYSPTISAVGSPFASQPSAPLPTPPPPASAPAPPTDDGDKPFIFYPEYEEALIPPPPPLFTQLSAPTHQPTATATTTTTAAAAANHMAAHYWPTASADYSHILNPAVSPGLLRANPPPVYDIATYESHPHPSSLHPHVSSHVSPGSVYASEQSSSLRSWAGY